MVKARLLFQVRALIISDWNGEKKTIKMVNKKTNITQKLQVAIFWFLVLISNRDISVA